MGELVPTKLTYFSANKHNLVLFIDAIVIFLIICIYFLFKIGLIANVPERVNMLNNLNKTVMSLANGIIQKPVNDIIQNPKPANDLIQNPFNGIIQKPKPANDLIQNPVNGIMRKLMT